MQGDAWLLIVDDDLALAELLARIIQRDPVGSSLAVEIATTPDAAVRVVEARCPDPLVVLSDYDLKAPIDGIQLLGLLKERCPGTRRILYSGHPREFVEPRLTDAVDAFYEKPDRLQDLVAPIFAHVQATLEEGDQAQA